MSPTLSTSNYPLSRAGNHTDYLWPAQLKSQRYRPFNPDKTDKLISKQRSLKVLLMDDNALMQDMLECLFGELVADYNLQILHAYNGRMGLRLLLSERPQIGLLDLNMSFLNGLEVLKQLQQSEAWQDGYRPHLLMLSGQVEANSIEQALSLGVEAYYTKPFSGVALLERLQQLVRIEQA